MHAPAGASTYINLGSWAEEEPDEETAHVARAARTHLVIRLRDGKPEAELLQWESGQGPRKLTPA
ncbi:MAG: hypothetical protein JNK04_03065 [Myxococcales bacterium]|nr:hypothetical protein [Myxococcales bacterium]